MDSTALLMDDKSAAAAAQQEEQRQHLKCPRCDSSNTKFCYYNNYSLSQPRHFCKSCKRYWTRGGTLRNVPVGGGCRKNKRLRRPSSSSFDTTTTTTTTTTPPFSSAQLVDVAPAANSPSVLLTPAAQIDLNPPIFYGLPTTAPEFPFSAGYRDHDELNHVGGVSTLGFSSAATPTIASLLASTFQYYSHKPSRLGSFQELSTPPPPYNDHQQDRTSRDDSSDINHVKVEEGQQWSNYIMSGCQNPMEQQVGLSDPFVFWNMSNTAASTTVGTASQFGLL